MNKRHKIYLNEYEDDDDEEYYDDEYEGSVADTTVLDGPPDMPVHTGILKVDGTPYLRHPIRIRLGFHPEDKRYHTPTVSDPFSDHSTGTLGWYYD